LSRDPAARRYAYALFNLGKKSGLDRLSEYAKDLTALVQAMKQEPKLMDVFKSPLFNAAEKRAVVSAVLKSLGGSVYVRNFCFLLADKNRLALLPDIQAAFGALLDNEQGIVRGELVTAVKLSEARQSEVLAKLEKQAGHRLALVFSVDAGILGGIMLKVGDRLLDASVRAQLGSLKETIRRGM
jgi:F-type H+-transporting ATPase subunit delta